MLMNDDDDGEYKNIYSTNDNDYGDDDDDDRLTMITMMTMIGTMMMMITMIMATMMRVSHRRGIIISPWGTFASPEPCY